MTIEKKKTYNCDLQLKRKDWKTWVESSNGALISIMGITSEQGGREL